MTKEEFGHWRQSDVTKALFSKLENEIQEKLVGLAWDAYDHPDIVKGYIRAYTNLVNLDYEDLYE